MRRHRRRRRAFTRSFDISDAQLDQLEVRKQNRAGGRHAMKARQKERLENVPNWKCRAQFLEVETSARAQQDC